MSDTKKSEPASKSADTDTTIPVTSTTAAETPAQAAKREASAAKAVSASAEGDKAEVQANMDAEQDKGYYGTVPDPTPNENYTVRGVAAGLPTPETDPEQAAKVGSLKFSRRAELRRLAGR